MRTENRHRHETFLALNHRSDFRVCSCSPARFVPRQYAASFAEPAFGDTSSPPVESRGVLEGFAHVQLQRVLRNHRVDVAPHIAVGAIALPSSNGMIIILRLSPDVASETGTDSTAVAFDNVVIIIIRSF